MSSYTRIWSIIYPRAVQDNTRQALINTYQSYHVNYTHTDPETIHRLEDNVGKGRVDILCRGKSGLDLVERIEMQQYYAQVHRPIAAKS